jgi:hypothetical protein
MFLHTDTCIASSRKVRTSAMFEFFKLNNWKYTSVVWVGCSDKNPEFHLKLRFRFRSTERWDTQVV